MCITNTDVEVDITDIPGDLRTSTDIQSLKLNEKITDTVKSGIPLHFQFSNEDKNGTITIQAKYSFAFHF